MWTPIDVDVEDGYMVFRIPQKQWNPVGQVYLWTHQYGANLMTVGKGWDSLWESLTMFSDDFMEERNQPETQIREDIW